MASPVSIESLEKNAHLSIPKNAINGKKPAGLEKGVARLTHVTNYTKPSVKTSHQKEKCAQMNPAHTFILRDGEILLPRLRLVKKQDHQGVQLPMEAIKQEPMAMVPKTIVKAQAIAMPKSTSTPKSMTVTKEEQVPKMKQVPKVQQERQQTTMEQDIRVDAKPREEEAELCFKEEGANTMLEEVNIKVERLTKEVNNQVERVIKEEREQVIEGVVNTRLEVNSTKMELVVKEEWVNTKVELGNNIKLGVVNIKVYRVTKVRCMEVPTQCSEMVEQATRQWLEEEHQDFRGLFKIRACHP